MYIKEFIQRLKSDVFEKSDRRGRMKKIEVIGYSTGTKNVHPQLEISVAFTHFNSVKSVVRN